MLFLHLKQWWKLFHRWILFSQQVWHPHFFVLTNHRLYYTDETGLPEPEDDNDEEETSAIEVSVSIICKYLALHGFHYTSSRFVWSPIPLRSLAHTTAFNQLYRIKGSLIQFYLASHITMRIFTEKWGTAVLHIRIFQSVNSVFTRIPWLDCDCDWTKSARVPNVVQTEKLCTVIVFYNYRPHQYTPVWIFT